MPYEDVQEIKELVNANHSEVVNRIEALRIQVTPVCKVYESMSGFGTVVVWIGKWVVTPIIVVIGAIATYKSLKQ